LPISEKFTGYAKEVGEMLEKAEIRFQLDLRNEKIGAKIRDAQLKKIPYMVIVGQKELETRTVSVRMRKKGDIGTMALESWIKKIIEEIDRRVLY